MYYFKLFLKPIMTLMIFLPGTFLSADVSSEFGVIGVISGTKANGKKYAVAVIYDKTDKKTINLKLGEALPRHSKSTFVEVTNRKKVVIKANGKKLQLKKQYMGEVANAKTKTASSRSYDYVERVENTKEYKKRTPKKRNKIGNISAKAKYSNDGYKSYSKKGKSRDEYEQDADYYDDPYPEYYDDEYLDLEEEELQEEEYIERESANRRYRGGTSSFEKINNLNQDQKYQGVIPE